MALKIALHDAMAAQGVTAAELARRMALDHKEVPRMLNAAAAKSSTRSKAENQTKVSARRSR